MYIVRVNPTSDCVLPAGHGVHAPELDENGRPFYGVDVYVSVCVLLSCILYAAVCSAPLSFAL